MKRAWSLVLAALVAGPLATLPVRPAASLGTLEAGRINRLPDLLPNYFIQPGHTPPDWNFTNRSDLNVAADPVNGRYFEFYQGSCDKRAGFPKNTAVYDLTTYRLVGTGCVSHLAAGTTAKNGAVLRYRVRTNAASGTAATIAFDHERGLFFLVANEVGAASSLSDNATAGVSAHQIAVFDEDTLDLVDVWDMPAQTPPHIAGLSLNARDHELIVTTDWAGAPMPGDTHPGNAVHVTAFDLRQAKGPGVPPDIWNVGIPSCVSSIQANSASLEAHRSVLRPALYVPCNVGYSGHLDATPSYRPGVVTVPLVSCPAGRLCPDATPGQEKVAVAPTSLQGFVFDPGSDRAFAPNNSAATGITLLVYDGPSNAFTGRTSIGRDIDANNASLGLDVRTGRLYGAGRSALTLLDGRRTPPGTGGIDESLAAVTQRMDIAVVPPGGRHPYTRVIVTYHECGGAQRDQNCFLDRMTVLADLVPVTDDPPAAAQDAATFNGPLAGRDTTVSYGGTVAGYGAHLDWVGAGEKAIDNEANSEHPTGQPLLEGTRDLLFGYVERLSLTDSQATATATAVGDGNGTTRDGFTSTTTQPWPYGTASCGYPGAIGHQQVSEPQLVSSANAVCDTKPAQADAADGGQALDTPGPVSVSIGSVWTTAQISPPAGKDGVTSTVTARVRAVRIDLGAAVGSVSIGDMEHTAKATATGRRGGAKTERTVTELHDVVVTTPTTGRVSLCAHVCGSLDGVVAQINRTFAAYLRIIRPEPDAELAKGTPGGFRASIQASRNDHYGDVQFNLMNDEEAYILPALRVVVYNDGNALSRLVVDLAGVKTDSHQSIDVIPQFGPDVPTTPIDTGVAQEHAVPPPLAGFKPVAGSTAIENPIPSGPFASVGRAIVRAFRGFAFLLRSPGELLSVLGLLVLLLTPALLMTRRRLWNREVFADPA